MIRMSTIDFPLEHPCIPCRIHFPDCNDVCPKIEKYNRYLKEYRDLVQKCDECVWSMQDGDCEGQCFEERMMKR